MVKVSVLLRSYNHERFVETSVESVLRQTLRDLEVILIDDASTDGSVARLRGLRDSRVRLVVHERRRGGTPTLNEGLALASGEYVAVQNSDDLWEERKLERQVDVLDRDPRVGAVFTGAEYIDDDGHHLTDPPYPRFTTQNRSKGEWLRQFFLFGNCLCHSSSLVRRALCDEVGGYNEALSSLPDFDQWIRIALRHELHVLESTETWFRLLRDGGNVSALTLANRIRHDFETTRILDSYLRIDSVAALLAAFPEAPKYGEVSREAIPYFLARLALDTDRRSHWLWGLEVLYGLLQRRDAAAWLEARYGLSPLGLAQLNSQKDFSRIGLEGDIAQPTSERDFFRRRWEGKSWRGVLSRISRRLVGGG